MNENDVKQLLGEWRLDASLPVDFHSRVWRRIEKARPVSFSRLFASWLEQAFSRPRFAVGYAAAALVIGLSLGQLHAARDTRQAQAELQFRYIHSIDPYAQRLPE